MKKETKEWIPVIIFVAVVIISLSVLSYSVLTAEETKIREWNDGVLVGFRETDKWEKTYCLSFSDGSNVVVEEFDFDYGEEFLNHRVRVRYDIVTTKSLFCEESKTVYYDIRII